MRRGIALLLLLSTLACAAFAQTKPAGAPRALPTEFGAWSGDFDGMLARRHIRVLIPFSRTLFFNDKGKQRGVTADLVQDFERYLNRKYAKQLGKRPLTVSMIPTTRDELLKDVAAGLGDIAAGNVTATDERKKIVDFIAPADQRHIDEIVLTGPNSQPVASAEELAGRTVHVRKATSYYESLVALNERLRKERKPAVKLVLVPDALEDEDMMEMLNAGLFDAIVVDDWVAKIWVQILPKIRLNEQAILRKGGVAGWAVRKGSPRLEAEITEFWRTVVKKQNLQEARLKQYYARVRQIRNNTASAERKRFDGTIQIFQKYGAQYGFDPLMLAAQGYQESQLRQDARSPVGAVGIMQLMPATGAELGVGDIHVAESNIHGGAKYMDQLMTKYFQDAKFSEADRTLFAFASYNAGPGRISQMRKLAAQRGLDRDKWFNNVELVTAEKVGMETTTYVRNIYKYYVAYRLMLEVAAEQKKARETLEKPP
ncbi:MAG: transglycosylase SLT domain-containing protein [Bacteroidota bacterium]